MYACLPSRSSTDLHVIWRVGLHVWSPREGGILGSNPNQNMKLQIAAAT